MCEWVEFGVCVFSNVDIFVWDTYIFYSVVKLQMNYMPSIWLVSLLLSFTSIHFTGALFLVSLLFTWTDEQNGHLQQGEEDTVLC